MASYIYSRVSTGQQDVKNQTIRLQQLYPDAKVVTEVVSGGKARPELQRLLETLNSGDRLIITSLDRLGRRAGEVILLVEDLDQRGIILVSLRENIDFSSLTGRFIFQVLAALAEMEKNLISERTKAALQTKRQQGVRLGRPPKYNPKKVSKVKSLRASGKTLKEISDELKIPLPTIQSILNR